MRAFGESALPAQKILTGEVMELASIGHKTAIDWREVSNNLHYRVNSVNSN